MMDEYTAKRKEATKGLDLIKENVPGRKLVTKTNTISTADCSPARQLNQGSRMKDTFDYSKVMGEPKTSAKKQVTKTNTMPIGISSTDCSPARQLNQGSRMKDNFDYSKVMTESKKTNIKKEVTKINT